MGRRTSGEIIEAQDIRECIAELSAERAEGIIRPLQERKLGVRFSFGETFFHSRPACFLLSGISEHGLQRLKPHIDLFIEVYNSSNRIAFHSSVLQHTPAGIYVTLPLTLSKAERRLSQRFKTHDDKLPFFDPGSFNLLASDVSAPPLFGMYAPLATMFPVFDLSFGGICLETRFPALISFLDANPNLRQAKLQFPMAKPMPVEFELRWTKRIREKNTTGELGQSLQKYRVGLAFDNPPRELMLEVGRFIKEMQMETAV